MNTCWAFRVAKKLHVFVCTWLFSVNAMKWTLQYIFLLLRSFFFIWKWWKPLLYNQGSALVVYNLGSMLALNFLLHHKFKKIIFNMKKWFTMRRIFITRIVYEYLLFSIKKIRLLRQISCYFIRWKSPLQRLSFINFPEKIGFHFFLYLVNNIIILRWYSIHSICKYRISIFQLKYLGD